MEAVCSSEALVHWYQITRRHIPEDSTVRLYACSIAAHELPPRRGALFEKSTAAQKLPVSHEHTGFITASTTVRYLTCGPKYIHELSLNINKRENFTVVRYKEFPRRRGQYSGRSYTVSAIPSKKLYMYMSHIPNCFRDRDISLYSSKIVDKKEMVCTVSNTCWKIPPST
jgi:hypothetical protein